MTVIDSVFCLDTRVIYKRETLSVVTHEWGEIMGIYMVITLGSLVKNRKTKLMLHWPVVTGACCLMPETMTHLAGK